MSLSNRHPECRKRAACAVRLTAPRSFSRYLLAFCLLGAGSVIAQEDAYHADLRATLANIYGVTGGTWVFSSNEVTNANATTGGGGARSVVTISGQTFTRATQLAITNVPANPWNAGLSLNTSAPIETGDRLLLVFWARAITAPNGIGLGNFTFENNVTYDKDITFEQRVGTTWKQYFLPFESKTNHPGGGAKFAVQLGVAVQTLQIGGLTVINYKKTLPLAALPTISNDEYVGMEPDAPWRAAAQARIEQHRKADLDIVVRDSSGQPIPGAEVTFEMLQHDYAFGTAINEAKIAGNRSQDNIYQEKLFNLDGNGRGFSEVVFENGHKWPSWEGNWSLTKAQKAATVKWLVDRGIRVRGHTLVWPSWRNSPASLQDDANNLPNLKNRINAHLDEVLTYPNMGGIIKDWDVINEPTGNVDIANAFQGSPGYQTGREIYVDIFNRVNEIDPSVKKYINEAHLTNFYARNDFFKSIVQEVVDKGGQIDGVGFQAHFRYFIPPEEMYAHFEEYHQITGGTVKITEYDNKTRAPKWLEAQYFRDLLTITFSHPHSDGFLMWGFWDGAHYAGRAPLFDINWNLKPEGEPFIDLVFGEWWTPETTVDSNTSGEARLRGFKGRYRVTIKVGDEEFVDTVELTSDRTLTYSQPFSPADGAPAVPPGVVRETFAGGTGTTLPQQYPGTVGAGWAGGWQTTSQASGTVLTTNPLSVSGGDYLRATRSGGTSGQEGVSRQWSAATRPLDEFSRVTFQIRLDSSATVFSSAADNISLSGRSVAGAGTGGDSTFMIRTFGAATGPLAAREWGVFNGVPGVGNAYDINRFIPTGLICQPGVTYTFTIDVFSAAGAGVTDGRTHGTYNVTITDGTTSRTVTGAGFRTAAYSAGGYLAFSTQQSAVGDNLTFSIDGIEMTALPTGSPLEQWRVAHFGTIAVNDPDLQSTVWGDSADPDGDGVVNLMEYATGTSPVVSASAARPNATVNSLGRLTLTFHRSRADLTYVIEGAPDPDGSWATVDTNPGSVGTTVTVIDNLPGTPDRRFLRLRVTSP